MVNDTTKPHGVYFRTLLLASSILGTKCNYLFLNPYVNDSLWGTMLYHMMFIFLIAGTFIIGMTPVLNNWVITYKSKHMAAQEGFMQNNLHIVGAVFVFFGVPSMEINIIMFSSFQLYANFTKFHVNNIMFSIILVARVLISVPIPKSNITRFHPDTPR